MTVLAAGMAALLLVGGGIGLYLTMSSQRLLAARLPARARVAGWLCLAGALVLLLGLMGPATAVFTWTIGLMATWTIPPVVIAWLRHRNENRG